MAFAPRDCVPLLVAAPLFALVAGAPPLLVFGCTILAAVLTRLRVSPLALAVAAYPLLQLLPIPRAFSPCAEVYERASEFGLETVAGISIAPQETLTDAVWLARSFCSDLPKQHQSVRQTA